ncbi:DUF397 domain-containing protein [Streptomyces sp. NPDC048603]|uniref:DUF397 domain-containing protein n=1 Tax=Streptomyces sp. NPDC048603 TaxID=3365577 RepID=UPI003710E7DA
MITQTNQSLQAPELWRKSSHSGADTNCVEVAKVADGGMAVRDSNDTARPGFHATAPAWAAFVRGVKGGGPV